MNNKQFASNEMYLGIKDHIQVVWYSSKGALGILMDRTQAVSRVKTVNSLIFNLQINLDLHTG